MISIDWNPPPSSLPAPLDPGDAAGATRAADVSAEPEPAPSRAAAEQRLAEWFHEHFARLRRFVLRLGVPLSLVDDVVQDAFIAANRRQADILEGRAWSFLVGAALRLAANYRLRASSRREVSQTERIEQEACPQPGAEQLLFEKQARQELERALSALSEAHRAVFVLYELEGFSVPEIAELTGLPLGTVASRLGRARARFTDVVARLQRRRPARPEVP